MYPSLNAGLTVILTLTINMLFYRRKMVDIFHKLFKQSGIVFNMMSTIYFQALQCYEFLYMHIMTDFSIQFFLKIYVDNFLCLTAFLDIIENLLSN